MHIQGRRKTSSPGLISSKSKTQVGAGGNTLGRADGAAPGCAGFDALACAIFAFSSEAKRAVWASSVRISSRRVSRRSRAAILAVRICSINFNFSKWAGDAGVCDGFATLEMISFSNLVTCAS